MTSPQVRVVVVNYNGHSYLAQCLKALTLQRFTEFEVVVVDDGSTHGSLEGAMPDDARFSVIRLGRNVGFARGSNLEAGNASARWVATLNPDAFPEPDRLGTLIDAPCRHPRVVMFGSTQLLAGRHGSFDGTGDCYLLWGAVAWEGNHRLPVSEPYPTGQVFGPCAAAALYDRAAFVSVGGFDETFFCYIELSRAMTWNPLHFLRRRGDVRPWR